MVYALLLGKVVLFLFEPKLMIEPELLVLNPVLHFFHEIGIKPLNTDGSQ